MGAGVVADACPARVGVRCLPKRPGRPPGLDALGRGRGVGRFPSSGRNLACGALNSARLLLGSAGDAHPHGLANGSDQAGRNYMRHNNVAVIALSRTPNPTRLQKTLALNDWYLKGEDRDYPWGGIQMLGESDGEQLQAMARSTPLRG
jgi:choline dehydrogenase-like flavoprotein